MNNCKYCKADCALMGKENLKECKGHIPMSNADHIRSMSDEELANLLTDYSNNGRWVTEIGREICFERTYEWLQQPAEPQKEDAI